eukprot:TRINITY_DN8252_c0_g1_i1.p2 TRINITY_DN8252_c0_g1~~TRINITY_DN8252_c0_g1_i1.p2  ORF type:complete len:157 (-),score=4.43 TRINITY_DN8252_c0_g1_i1:255-725(-)
MLFVNRSLRDVYHRQNRKDKRLQRTDEDTETLPCSHKWNAPEAGFQNHRDQNLTSKDVGIKPDCQSYRFCQVLNDIERQEDRERFDVVLQVMLAIQFQAQIVHENEHDNRKTGRNGNVRCWRLPPQYVGVVAMFKSERSQNWLTKDCEVFRQVGDN